MGDQLQPPIMEGDGVSTTKAQEKCLSHRTSTFCAAIATILYGIVAIVSAARSNVSTLYYELNRRDYGYGEVRLHEIVNIFYTITKIDYIFIAFTTLTGLLLFGVVHHDHETRKQRRSLLIPFILANALNGILGIVGIIIIVVVFGEAITVVLIVVVVFVVGVLLRLILAILMGIHYRSLMRESPDTVQPVA